MNLNVAQKLANDLLIEHGLVQKGWYFQFDNSKRRFGVCKYGKKVIGLSRELTLLNDVVNVKDTILHEIAHAIAGRGAGHGWLWKQVCIRIGAKPERCYSSNEVNTPLLKYQATCGACGALHQKAKMHKKGVRRSCKCQSGKDWDSRVLLEYKAYY
jgi:predicted SprT family Zn-dependent metalloprotease